MARTKKHMNEVVELRAKGKTIKEIADKLDISMTTVWTNLQLAEAENKKIQEFNKNLPSYLSKVIARLTDQLISSDISKLSPYQMVGMLSMLIDKQRLLTGQSTSNSAVLFNLVSQACAPEKEASDK